MLIYIILVIIILILPMLKVDKKKYCIIIGVLMTCIIGFRSIEMGMGDTKEIYISIFDQLASLSLRESFNFIRECDIEIVFYFLTRLYLVITNNARIYIFLLSIPLNFSISRFIYKYSKTPSISFIMFLSLNYFGFSFTLIRHCISLAILIYSYDYIYKKDFKKFMLTVFIAGLFHRTAWIFFIAYPIANKFKIGIKNIIIPLVVAIFAYLVGDKILLALSYFIKSEHYMQYFTIRKNTITFFLINFSMLIFILYIAKKSNKNEKYEILKQQINLMTIGTSIASCMVFLSEMFRISTFFTIYSITLLPNVIALIKNKKIRLMMIIILYIIYIVYFFAFSMKNNEIYPYILGGWKR